MVQVVIRHKDGREYEIASGDFRRGKHVEMPGGERVSYADAGFRVVSMADGQPYTGPLNETSEAPTP